MSRTDSASKLVEASPARIYAALVSAEARAQWLPPAGMTGRFDWFDPRPGGGYHMTLTYNDPADAGHTPKGKTTVASDVVSARFIELTPDRRIIEEVDFESDDPAFAGTMRMTWTITPQGEGDAGAVVVIEAAHVPSGVSAADHQAGLDASLTNLAAWLG
jgi:uncharacterized protein YndB with AHSA1/START domain